jgi:hypothetical protein
VHWAQVFSGGKLKMKLQQSVAILLITLSLCSSTGCGAHSVDENRLHVESAAETIDVTEVITGTTNHAKITTQQAETTTTTTDTKLTTTAPTTTKGQKQSTTKKATTTKASKTTTSKVTVQNAKATTVKVAQNAASVNVTTKQVTTQTVATTVVTKEPTVAIYTTPVTEPVVTETPVSADTESYISLNDGLMQGSGIVVTGNQISIQTAGTYHISGAWNGNICVQAADTDTVKLSLEGVNIQSLGTPAIQVQNADKVVVTAVEGTENYLSTSGTDADNNAALYSQDDLRIEGNGTLEIVCDNEHGIACNNNLEIENSVLSVTAEKTAIFAHESITISSGTITAKGDNGGIISDSGQFYIEGGTVLAMGMNNTQPYTIQPVMQMVTSQELPKESDIAISVNGMEAVHTITNKKANHFLFSSPDLFLGSVCDFYSNGALLASCTQDSDYAYYELP